MFWIQIQNKSKVHVCESINFSIRHIRSSWYFRGNAFYLCIILVSIRLLLIIRVVRKKVVAALAKHFRTPWQLLLGIITTVVITKIFFKMVSHKTIKTTATISRKYIKFSDYVSFKHHILQHFMCTWMAEVIFL